MLTPNTILQNRYRIIRQLGQGGMGTVYEAVDQRFDSQVAIKETHFSDDVLRKQFEREARLLNRLRHPAMTRVIDHFSENDGQFLVMDFVVGEELWEMLQKRGKAFPVDKVLAWADQLLDALDYLHKQDPPIIHRDIKPQNLKLSDTGQIILLDFGLAKGFAGQISRVTTSGSIFGYTPNYAPLEQIQGTGTDARTDLYSLAATLYHLLTGIVPPDVLTRLTATTEGQPDPLRPANELNPSIPSDVASVLNKAMAIGRNQRFGTAAEMREGLRKANPFKEPINSQVSTTVLPPTIVIPTSKEQGQEDILIPPTIASPTIASPTQSAGKKEPSPTNARQTSEFDTPVKPVSDTLLFGGNIAPSEGGSKKRVPFVIGALLVVFLIAGAALWLSMREGNENLTTANKENVKQAGMPTTANMPSTVKNSIGMEFVLVPAGEFMMGSSDADVQRAFKQMQREGSEAELKDFAPEKPQHKVTINYPFYMGKYEVTQDEWKQIIGYNPSTSRNCDQCPVENISWDDAQDFIRKLNERNDGYTYRLPTEAEWEYACRAGTAGDYAGNLDAMAWYNATSGGNLRPVGQKQANRFGLYDMHGNVQEWCEDVWHADYNGAPSDGSAWLSGGESKYRVLRGGTRRGFASTLRSAARFYFESSSRGPLLSFGFRLVAVART